ncbi:hypothetical protein, partial [Nonomuraea basaltis]|uniref:hypothetical protein n=1 Tax=Nonomuraea basaltis TaxID=2495887 RepID=UPI00197F7021
LAGLLDDPDSAVPEVGIEPSSCLCHRLVLLLGDASTIRGETQELYRKDYGFPMSPEQWNTRPESIATWGSPEQHGSDDASQPLATADVSAN